MERQTEVKLYPEDDEPVNILNIKRGIVSALMVPEMTEEKNQNVVNLFACLSPIRCHIDVFLWVYGCRLIKWSLIQVEM